MENNVVRCKDASIIVAAVPSAVSGGAWDRGRDRPRPVVHVVVIKTCLDKKAWPEKDARKSRLWHARRKRLFGNPRWGGRKILRLLLLRRHEHVFLFPRQKSFCRERLGAFLRARETETKFPPTWACARFHALGAAQVGKPKLESGGLAGCQLQG